MFRFVSSFPGGLSGVGLLLLRLAVGSAAAFQGFAYVAGHDGLTLLAWCSTVLAIVSGAALVLGFLTPLASSLICLDALLLALLKVPVPGLGLSSAMISTVLVVVVAAAITLVGPGALSVDARVFGLRRITIPRTPEPPD